MDPWGADTNRSNNAAFQPKKFTSYERDANGSDEAMFRRSNRWHSRFDQPDPYDGSYALTNPQSFNRYAYVHNDPVNFIDPTGLLIAPVQPCTLQDGNCVVTVTVGGLVGNAALFSFFYFSGFSGGGWGPGAGGDPGGGGGGGGGGKDGATGGNMGKDPDQQSDCSKFVDGLVLWAKSAQSQLWFGRALGASALAGSENSKQQSVSGFRSKLVGSHNEQGGDVYKHIMGHAGATLIGDNPIVPFGTETGTQREDREWQNDVDQYLHPENHKPHTFDEAYAEMMDDIAGRNVGRMFHDFLNGDIDDKTLGNQIFSELCDY